MDRFFLGLLTGMGALVVPLLLSSLLLPGPEGTFLNIGGLDKDTQGSLQDGAKNTTADTALPTLVPFEIPQLGIAIDLPENWTIVRGPAITGEPSEKRIKDVISIARLGPLSAHAPHHLRMAFLDGPMIDARIPVGVGMKRLSKKHPTSEITRQPDLSGLGPFSGGSGAIKITRQLDGQPVTIDADIWMLDIGRGWLSLATSVSDTDPQDAEIMQKVLASLRKI